MKFLLSILLVLFLMVDCDIDPLPGSVSFSIDNKSDETIAALNSVSFVLPYPDTTFTVKYEETVLDIDNPMQFMKVPAKTFVQEPFYYDPEHLRDTISVYIFNYDTLKIRGLRDVAANYNILVRYDYSRQQLEEFGYCIEYPPSPRMKDVKMYPPFATFYKE